MNEWRPCHVNTDKWMRLQIHYQNLKINHDERFNFMKTSFHKRFFCFCFSVNLNRDRERGCYEIIFALHWALRWKSRYLLCLVLCLQNSFVVRSKDSTFKIKRSNFHFVFRSAAKWKQFNFVLLPCYNEMSAF